MNVAENEEQLQQEPEVPLTDETQETVSTDLLEDPVEYPIDNMAELTQLEDAAPQTTDVIVGAGAAAPTDPTAVVELMSVATEAFHELMDIHSTIKHKGVSQHDIREVGNIHARLTKAGLVIPAISLENWYTEERSFLNINLGLEDVTKLVIDTIKGWLRVLVDMLTKSYRWVKDLQHNQDKLNVQLDKARDMLVDIRAGYLEMRTLANQSSTIAVDGINELAKGILLNPSLPRNRITLFGFSDPKAVAELKSILANAVAGADYLQKQVNDLNIALERKDDTLTGDYTCAVSDLVNSGQDVNKFGEIDPDEDWLVNHLGDEWWDNVAKWNTVKVLDYSKLVKAYGRAADVLSKLRSIKVDDEESIGRVQVHVDSITKCMNELNKAISFFRDCARAQINAAKTYREFYEKVCAHTMLAFQSRDPSAQSRKRMQEIVTKISKIR